MPYSSPAAIVTGTTISKTTFGDVVKSDLDYLANPPSVRVGLSGNVSLPSSGTPNVISWNTERWKTVAGMHSNVTNSSRLIAPDAGLYIITWTMVINVGSDYRNVFSFARVNGSTQVGAGSHIGTHNDAGTSGVDLIGSTVWKMAASDYVEILVVQQNAAAAAKNLLGARPDTEFQMTWIGLG